MGQTIGNKVMRELRDVLQLSQRAAAKRAGVSDVQWAQVEAGNVNKSFSTRGWLAIWHAFEPTLRGLGYECDDLLRGRRRSGRKAAA